MSEKRSAYRIKSQRIQPSALVGILAAYLTAACAPLDSGRVVPPASPQASKPKVAQAARSGRDAAASLLHQADQDYAEGHPDLAIAHLERALRIAPRDARVYQRLAKVYLSKGELNQAKQMALKGIRVARQYSSSANVQQSLQLILDQTGR